MEAFVFFVSRVQLDVTIPAPLMFEQAITVVALEGHLVTVDLQNIARKIYITLHR